MELSRWQFLMQAFGVANADSEFARLEAAYSQPQRFYHTVEHIDDCLARFREFETCADRPEEVEAALWFHDAIYRPRSSSNEADSAIWASRFFGSHGVGSNRCARIHAHILATRHRAAINDSDSNLVVDIDLSILGRCEADYARFEENVRKEYRWVPSAVFRRRRCEILRSFLDRDTIYTHRALRDEFEAPARRNLTAAIARLAG